MSSRLEDYRRVFNDFKELCAKGKQPCTFSAYCREHGVNHTHMHEVLKDEFQPVKTLPGYKAHPHARPVRGLGCKDVHFEEILVKESGFFPSNIGGREIRVMLGGNTTVCFPADMDVAAIARFVGMLGKEDGHVGA